MVDLQELLWGFSVISLLLYSIQGVKKVGSMALTLKSPTASRSSLPPEISWVDRFFGSSTENSKSRSVCIENDDDGKQPPNKLARTMNLEESIKQENGKRLHDKKVVEENEQSASLGITKVGDVVKEAPNKLRKRPSRLVLPEYSPSSLEFCTKSENNIKEYFEVEGRDFFLAGKQGRRVSMEDGHGVLVDIMGDPKQVRMLISNMLIEILSLYIVYFIIYHVRYPTYVLCLIIRIASI